MSNSGVSSVQRSPPHYLPLQCTHNLAPNLKGELTMRMYICAHFLMSNSGVFFCAKIPFSGAKIPFSGKTQHQNPSEFQHFIPRFNKTSLLCSPHSKRGDRGWKEAQRQGEDRMTWRKTLIYPWYLLPSHITSVV